MRIINIFSCLALAAMSANAITISDVVKSVEQNNLSIKAAVAANKAEVEGVKAENSLPATSIEYSPFFRSGVTGLASSELIVSQEFEFPTVYSARNRAADSMEARLENTLAAQRRALRIETVQECFKLVNAYKQRDLLTERIGVTDSLLTLYNRKLELRSATQIDVNKISLAKQELQLALLENNVIVEEAVSRIQALNGGEPLDLTSLDYETSIDQIAIPSDISAAVMSRPEVAEALAGVNEATQQIAVSKKENLPSFSLGYRLNTEVGEASNGFLVGVSVPLFSMGRKRRAAEAQKAAAQAEVDNAIMNSKTEIDAALRSMKALRATIDACDTNLIKETLNLYLRSLQQGRTTLTDYYLETNQLYDRLQTLRRLEYEYRNAAAILAE